MAAPLPVEPVSSGNGGRRGNKSSSKTSLEKTGHVDQKTPERTSNEPDDPDEDNRWMPDHDPRDERGEFESRAQFLLTVIGYALGNGNFWHFPLAARKFGGGTFLCIYFLCMALFGVPMLYLEMMIGQIAQVGPMRAFKLNFPLMQGVGWAVCSLSFLRAVNFALLNSISLEYAVESLIGVATRTVCTNEWNSNGCFSPSTNAKKCGNTTMVWYNKTCITIEDRLRRPPEPEHPAREYFRHIIRGLPALFEEGIAQENRWSFESGRVIFCFFIVWFFAAFCLLRKFRWIGKLSMVIVSAAGVLSVIFMIRALFLPRADIGLAKFFDCDLSKFLDRQAWQEGVIWTRTSLSLGMGGMISLSAYRKRSSDSFWDSVVISVVIAMVSVIAGMSIFIIISNDRHKFPFFNWQRQSMTGYTLYYIYYPEVIGQLPFAALWSFLFFTTLLALGTTTFFGLLETPVSALTDQFKFCRKHRASTVLALVCIGFGAGLVQCTQIGFTLFYLLDVRVIPVLGLIMTGFELLTVFLYGPRNFYRDINASIGKKVNFFGYVSDALAISDRLFILRSFSLERLFLSPYGLIVRICHFVLCPCLLAFATGERAYYIFDNVKRGIDEKIGNSAVPNVLASFSFFPYPMVLVGLIAALAKHVRAGKPWFDLIRPDPAHPAIRYKVPPPLGCIFGLKPIEAMPSAMGDDKAVEFPDKKEEPPKVEEEVVEIGRA